MEYNYPKFTPEMKKTHTILIPNMAITQFRLLEYALRYDGYKCEILGNCGSAVAQLGLKYVHNDTCYPALLVIGQFLDALNSGKYDLEHTALLITQTGGGCRASNYIHLLRKALVKAGYPNIPVASLNFSGLEKDSGFQMTLPLARRAIASVFYGDMLCALRNQVAPYENEQGAADKMVDLWVERLGRVLLAGKGYTSKEMKHTFPLIAKDFKSIPVTRVPKVKVGVVGEIYVKYSPLGNNDLQKFLESQDCEVNFPGLMGFVQYCIFNMGEDHVLYGGKLAMKMGTDQLLNWLDSVERSMLKAEADAGFYAPGPFKELVEKPEGIISLGAKMHEFAGYNMPIEYSGIIDEHLTVCQGVGVFDVSHMGEFWVKGPHALDFLQKVTSNNIAALTPGKVQYTCFPNENGGIVDDLLVYHYEPEKYLLVVNASNIEKDWNWCVSHNTEGAELENASEHMAQLAVQGPKAIQALQKLTSINLSDLPYYTFTHGEFAGEKDVIISNTGYTGAGGFELYFYPEAAMKIWDAVFEAGAEFGIKPVGLGARDTLRLEMGFCLYGNDLDDTTSPIEAGLGWITKFVEGKNFTNRPMLEKQKAEGTTRKLVGFEMIDRGIPRHGYELYSTDGTAIGVVTSGTMSPTRKIGIGMGYIRPEYSKVGTEICIDMRGRKLKAVVVKPPFRKQ